MSSRDIGRAFSTLGEGLFSIAEHKMAGERDQIKMDHDFKMEELRTKNNRQLQKDQLGQQQKLADKAFTRQQTLALTAFGRSKTVAELQHGFQMDLEAFRAEAGATEAYHGVLASIDTKTTKLIADIDPGFYDTPMKTTNADGKEEMTTQGDWMEERIRRSAADNRTRVIEARVNSRVFAGDNTVETEAELAEQYVQEGMFPEAAEFRAKANWTARGLDPDAVTPETVGEMPLVSEMTPQLEAAQKQARKSYLRDNASTGAGASQQAAAQVGDPLYSGAVEAEGGLPMVHVGGPLEVMGAGIRGAAKQAKDFMDQSQANYLAIITQATADLKTEIDPMTGAPWAEESPRWSQALNKKVVEVIRKQDPSYIKPPKPQMAAQPAPPPEIQVPQAGGAPQAPQPGAGQQGPPSPQSLPAATPQTPGGGGQPTAALFDVER